MSRTGVGPADIASLRGSEKALLSLNGNYIYYYWQAIKEAVQRRRDTRESAPDAWDMEDALLDLLQFFIKHDSVYALPECA